MIDSEILESHGAAKISLPANNFLFFEGDPARFYYQVISGQVIMININYDGKEFTQGTFSAGQSFGEPPLFHDEKYPASAKSTQDVKLYKLHKDRYFDLLKAQPEIVLHFTKVLAKRLMYKSMIMKEISIHDAEHRILTFIDYLKNEYGSPENKFQVELTRQQLSNLLGIRVETVIRAIKHLEEKGELIIQKRKILR